MNGIKKFLDTAPIIYFIEKNEHFFDVVKPIFTEAESKKFILITSVISYLETMVPVLGSNNISLKGKYHYFFYELDFLKVVDIDINTAHLAAKLKSTYNLKTPDSLQLASAIYNECDEFITADKRIPEIKEIKITLLP